MGVVKYMFIYFMGFVLLIGVALMVAYKPLVSKEETVKQGLLSLKAGILITTMSATYLIGTIITYLIN